MVRKPSTRGRGPISRRTHTLSRGSGGTICPCRSYCCLQFLPQLPVRLPIELKIQISRPDQLLVLRFPQVQAVAIDEVLYCRIDQVGDVPAQVDVFPDAGGADILQVSGELQLDDLAADAAQVRVDLVAFGIAGAAEDDVVQGVDGAGVGAAL